MTKKKTSKKKTSKKATSDVRPEILILEEMKDIGYRILADRNVFTVRKCLQTDLPILDVISARDENGVWGLPFGAQIEIAGNPDSCKTTLLMSIAAAAQKQGHIVAWVETEHSLNKSRAEILGANLDKFNLIMPEYLEESMIKIKKTTLLMPKKSSKKFDPNMGMVILFDSLAATPPLAELNPKKESEEFSKQTAMGEFARKMFRFQRVINKRVSDRNVLIVYANQLKATMAAFGKRWRAYGGNAVKFHARLCFETTYTGRIKDSKGNIIGITFNLENTKNKHTNPFKKVENIEFRFDRGFDKAQLLIWAMEELGLAKKTGAEYFIDGYSKDKEDTYTMLKFRNRIGMNPELYDTLRGNLNDFQG